MGRLLARVGGIPVPKSEMADRRYRLIESAYEFREPCPAPFSVIAKRILLRRNLLADIFCHSASLKFHYTEDVAGCERHSERLKYRERFLVTRFLGPLRETLSSVNRYLFADDIVRQSPRPSFDPLGLISHQRGPWFSQRQCEHPSSLPAPYEALVPAAFRRDAYRSESRNRLYSLMDSAFSPPILQDTSRKNRLSARSRHVRKVASSLPAPYEALVPVSPEYLKRASRSARTCDTRCTAFAGSPPNRLRPRCALLRGPGAYPRIAGSENISCTADRPAPRPPGTA